VLALGRGRRWCLLPLYIDFDRLRGEASACSGLLSVGMALAAFGRNRPIADLYCSVLTAPHLITAGLTDSGTEFSLLVLRICPGRRSVQFLNDFFLGPQGHWVRRVPGNPVCPEHMLHSGVGIPDEGDTQFVRSKVEGVGANNLIDLPPN
jgi:hypothetical protein